MTSVVNPYLPALMTGEFEDLNIGVKYADMQAHELGFDYVDIEHSHGNLRHDILSAHIRSDNYCESFGNRTHFLENCTVICSAAAGALNSASFGPMEGVISPRSVQDLIKG